MALQCCTSAIPLLFLLLYSFGFVWLWACAFGMLQQPSSEMQTRRKNAWQNPGNHFALPPAVPMCEALRSKDAFRNILASAGPGNSLQPPAWSPNRRVWWPMLSLRVPARACGFITTAGRSLPIFLSSLHMKSCKSAGMGLELIAIWKFKPGVVQPLDCLLVGEEISSSFN